MAEQRTIGKTMLRLLKAALLPVFICLAILSACTNEYIVPRTTIVPEIPDITAEPTAEAVPSGGILSAAVLGSADSINPINTLNEDIIDLSAFFYEPLIRLGSSMSPEPVLAEDWRSDDAVNWTIKLRENVFFHDGSPLTGEDVAMTIGAVKQGGGAYADLVSKIAEVTASGSEVSIRLSEKDGLFPWKLFFPILKANETGSKYPSGTGPFSVTDAHFYDGGVVRFDRFEGYREGKTNIDAFELRFFSDAAKKAVSGCDIIILTDDAAIKYGSQLGYGVRRFDDNSLICIVPYLYTGEKITYDLDGKNKIEQLPTKRIEATSLNMRQALAEIVDRERAIERTVSGWGKAYDLPGFDNCIFRKNIELRTPSITAAEKLLEAEGYKHEGGNSNWFTADDTDKKKPLTVNFLVDSEDVELIHACDSVVSKLKSLGVKTTVKVATGGEFTALFLSGEYDYTFLRLNMSFAPDMADAFANDSIFNYNGYDTSWITGKLSGMTGGWKGGKNGPEACADFADQYCDGMEEIYARLKNDIPFLGLYVRSNCLLYSGRLNWSDSAGVESWNLFPDITEWYLV
ncbi:MAG: ABC transporter substrate-binding protein [Clostridia bacterium]|nr:ABC transporter substrate-binding protein [Clostridia bacterium]